MKKFTFAVFTITPEVVRFCTATDLDAVPWVKDGPSGSTPHNGDPAGTLAKLVGRFPSEKNEILTSAH